MQKKIVLATNNLGKVREIQALVPTHAELEFVPQTVFSIPEIEETGLTFIENALLKARNASQHSNLPAIGDDSGLEVDVLQGAPGIYSARYAGVGATDQANIQKLLQELAAYPSQTIRTARFICVMVYLRHATDSVPLISQGVWEGYILDKPQGKAGFGYDPVFYIPNYHCTAAELPLSEKNRMSHRSQALQTLLKLLFQKKY